MAIAYVNSAFSTSSTTAGTSKTISYTPTAGNTLIVFCFGVGVAATKVTDTKANLYQPYVPPTTSTVTATTFICRSCNGGATTITVTFASSTRNTVVVVEYSGALEVGKTNTATGSSTAPSVAITTQDNNNVVCAGMTTEGTSTWALSVGTALRNSQVGGGATTPGGGVIDNTSATPASTTETATLGTTGAWVAHAVELRTVVVPLLTDQNIDYYNQAALPPWRAGNLKLYAEDEQFSWGYLFDTKMSIDNERFDQPPKMQSYTVPELDTDTEWGYAVPLSGVGSQSMGYSGHWAQKPAMGSDVDAWSFNPPAPTPINPFDEDGGIPLIVLVYQETDSDQLTPEGFASDRVPEDYEQWVVPNQLAVQWTDDDTGQSGFFTLEQYGDVDEQSLPWSKLIIDDVDQQNFVEAFAQDDQPQPLSVRITVQEEEPMLLLVGVAPLPNMLYDTDFNPTMQFGQAFGLEDPDWGYKSPTLATYQEDSVYQDRWQLQSLTPEIETEQFDWGYNVPLAGIGSQMQEYSGFWVSKPAMGSEVDAWGYNPVAAPTAITPFADEQTPVQFTLQYQDVEDAAFNPVIVGTGGTQLMGFRGYGYYKAAMQPDEQWSFNAPVVTVITPFDFDQQPLQASMMVAEVEEIDINTSAFYAPAIFDPGDEFQPLAQALAVQTEDEQVYPRPPFLTPIGFDDSPEQVAKPWVMYDDVETFGYSVSQTFAEPQEFGPAQQRTFVPEIEDESAQVYPNPPFITAMPFDDSPEQLPNITVVMDIDHTLFVFGVFVGSLPNMLYDADFNPTMQQSFYFTSPEDEQFNWGYNPPLTKVDVDDAPYFTGLWTAQPVADDVEQFGFNPPAHVAISGFDQDDLQPMAWRAIDYDLPLELAIGVAGGSSQQMAVYSGQWAPKAGMDAVEQFGFNPPVVAAISGFDQDEVPVVRIALALYEDDVIGRQPAFAIDHDQQPLWAAPVTDDTDPYGQKPPFINPTSEVWELMGLPAWPPLPTTYQLENDQIGQNPPFLVAIGVDDGPEHFKAVPFITDDVEMYGSNPTFVSDAWELAGLPASLPFLYQDDVEVIGRQVPIAYPSHTQEDDQAPRFPLWSLAWVEDDEALLGIVPRHVIVPIVYKVENEALLELIVRSQPFLYVATAQGQLALSIKSISGVPGILVGPVSSTGIISVQGITVQ